MNTKVYTGYKIVKVKKGKRVSAFTYGKDVCTYRKGRWTEPKSGCGPLCVLKKPVTFRLRRDEEIWECKFEKSPLRTVWTLKHKTPIKRLMRGTVLASRVKLKRKL